MPRMADEELSAAIATVIGGRLREIRLEWGLTQEQLAERLGSQKPNVSRVESGKTVIGSRTLLRWCRALAVRPERVLSAIDDEALRAGGFCPDCQVPMTPLDDGRMMCEGCGRTM